MTWRDAIAEAFDWNRHWLSEAVLSMSSFIATTVAVRSAMGDWTTSSPFFFSPPSSFPFSPILQFHLEVILETGKQNYFQTERDCCFTCNLVVRGLRAHDEGSTEEREKLHSLGR